MISVEVDSGSPVPVFEQLRSQIEWAIRAGELTAGHPLPTVRQLAADLGLAPNTVARAYRELERAGLITTSGRRGTRVNAPPRLSTAERRAALNQAAQRYLREARLLGWTTEDCIAVLRTKLD